MKILGHPARAWLWTIVAASALGVCTGMLATHILQSSSPISRLKTWARFDMIRDGARWGFRHGTDDAAMRLVSLEVRTLEQCDGEIAAGYPCRGKLRLEAYLMLGALYYVAGQSDAVQQWTARMVAECNEGHGTDCSAEDAQRRLRQLVSLRQGQTSDQ